MAEIVEGVISKVVKYTLLISTIFILGIVFVIFMYFFFIEPITVEILYKIFGKW